MRERRITCCGQEKTAIRDGFYWCLICGRRIEPYYEKSDPAVCSELVGSDPKDANNVTEKRQLTSIGADYYHIKVANTASSLGLDFPQCQATKRLYDHFRDHTGFLPAACALLALDVMRTTLNLPIDEQEMSDAIHAQFDTRVPRLFRTKNKALAVNSNIFGGLLTRDQMYSNCLKRKIKSLHCLFDDDEAHSQFALRVHAQYDSLLSCGNDPWHSINAAIELVLEIMEVTEE